MLRWQKYILDNIPHYASARKAENSTALDDVQKRIINRARELKINGETHPDFYQVVVEKLLAEAAVAEKKGATGILPFFQETFKEVPAEQVAAE